MNLLRPSDRTPFLIGAAFIAACTLAACGGGGSPSVLNPGGTPVTNPTPPTIPAAVFTPVTTIQSISTPAPTPAGQTPAPNATPPSIPLVMPSAAGIGGSVNLPLQSTASGGTQSSIPPGTQVTQQLLPPGQPPAGLPVLSIGRHTADASTRTAIAYLGIYFSNPVTLAIAPVITFNVPASTIVAGTSYYLALYDPLRPQLGWQDGFEGPGTVGTSSISFGGSGVSNPFSYAGFAFYWFALYGQSTAISIPTAAPSASPLPTPTPPVSTPTPSGPTPAPTPTPPPANIAFTAIGQTQTFTASGSQPFSATGNDPHVATITNSGGTGTFTVTAVGVGTTTATVTDLFHNTQTVTISVTSTTIPIQ